MKNNYILNEKPAFCIIKISVITQKVLIATVMAISAFRVKMRQGQVTQYQLGGAKFAAKRECVFDNTRKKESYLFVRGKLK